jgi:hypothetical protein
VPRSEDACDNGTNGTRDCRTVRGVCGTTMAKLQAPVLVSARLSDLSVRHITLHSSLLMLQMLAVSGVVLAGIPQRAELSDVGCASWKRAAFIPGWSCLLGAPRSSCASHTGSKYGKTGGPGGAGVCSPECSRHAGPVLLHRARTLSGGALTLLAQFQSGEQQAKWRPPPLGDSYAESDDFSELTPSDDSDDSREDDASGQSAKAGSSSGAGQNDLRTTGQVVIGAGALRGEQDAYSMRDLQSMKVPRLRSMCESRGLKKNGTKQQLIARLLASTADTLDILPGWANRKTTPSPTRLNPQMSTNVEDGLLMTGSASNEALEDSLDRDSLSYEGDEVPLSVWGEGASNLNSRSTLLADQEPRLDEDYRPTGAALEAIINAPRLRRRAGVTHEFASSRITKYERDRTEVPGTRISGMPIPLDAAEANKKKEAASDKKKGAASAAAAAVGAKDGGTKPSAKSGAKFQGPPNPVASTLNGIPREFLPPSLRVFDPNARNRRRGPGRPRAGEDDGDEMIANQWAVVKSGGGMTDNVQESPFDAMIARDIEEEERLNPKRKRRAATKKSKAAEIEEEDVDDENELLSVQAQVKKDLLVKKFAEEGDDEGADDDDIDDELPDIEEEEEFVKSREVSSIKVSRLSAPQTRNPEPETHNPKPETRNPKP